MNKLYLLLFFIGISFISPNDIIGQDLYYVYSESFDNGVPSGTMGVTNGNSLQIDPSNTDSPFKGDKCLKISASGSEAWSGVYIQKGGAWREQIEVSNPLADLSTKKYLVVSARSEASYTIAKLGMGEGKEATKSESAIALTPTWQRFVLELPAEGLSRVNGLFLVVFENKGTIYLDEIFYAGDSFSPSSTDVVIKERKEPLDPTSFYIYGDKFENGIPNGYMGEKNGLSIKFDDNWKINPYLGTKCIKIEVNKTEAWRGLYFLYTGKWNAVLNDDAKLADLRAYDKLEFFARADVKDSEPYLLSEIGIDAGTKTEDKRSDTYVEIGSKWKKYTINLKGLDLKAVNALLLMVLPVGTVYLDEIRFLKKKEKQ